MRSPQKKIQKNVLPCQGELLQTARFFGVLEGETMRKFKRRQRHSVPFGLFLAMAAALLLLAAVAPRANAGPTDYWNFEDPLGSRPRLVPELFSQPQGVVINQPLAFNDTPTLALNVASGEQPGGFQPLVPDANASWIGGVSSDWSVAGNWTTGGPPTTGQIATFDANFTGANQPNITGVTLVGELHMATGVTQNVTISASSNSLTISGVGGTGILIDNTNAFTLTITAPIVVPTSQAWTNNSGNLFTVSSPTITLGNNDVITVNGTGNTLISANIGGGNPNSGLTMAGSGTLTLTGSETYGATTTVNGGTLLVNGSILNGVTVNNAGSTLGGIGTITGAVGVGAGANISPGNGGNTTGILQTGALTLASGSNFRVDINGTTAGTYDQIQVTQEELRFQTQAILWSQSARHCRSGRHL